MASNNKNYPCEVLKPKAPITQRRIFQRKPRLGTSQPIRLDKKELELLLLLQEKTGVSKSYLIRKCIDYALPKFMSEEVDFLNLEEKS